MTSTDSTVDTVTLKTIAEKLGISVSTVSLVLNGKAREKKIARETEARVLEVAAELNYRPNFLAAQFRRSTPKLLMICLEHLHDLHSGIVAEAFARRAAERGYHVMLSPCLDGSAPLSQTDAVLGSQGAPGLAVIGSAAERIDKDTWQRWLDRGVRVVLIEWRINDPRVSHVLTDEKAGGRIAAGHLYRQGPKNLWMIGGLKRYPFTDRVKGAQSAARKAGARPPRVFWAEKGGESWARSGYEAIRDAIQEPGTRPPDALLGVGGIITLAGIRALSEAGLSVGRDYAAATFYGGTAAEFFSPPITSIEPPIEEAGAAAADLLIGSLEGTRHPGEEIILQPNLRLRVVLP